MAKRKKSSKISPLEAALIFRISIEKEEKLQDLLNRDFQLITDWSAASACMYVVEVMFSHALCPDAVFHNAANEWLGTQDDKQLIIAVALREAGFSEEQRRRILLFFDKHQIELEGDSKRLWHKLRTQDLRSPWEEIRSAVGLTGKWQSMPPKNRGDLSDTCRRLMRKPDSDCLPGIVKYYIQEVDLKKFSHLRQAIVEAALFTTKSVFDLFIPIFQLFVADIVAILTREARSLYDFSEEAQSRYYVQLCELALFFAGHLDLIPDEKQRDKLAIKLLKSTNNRTKWNLVAIKELALILSSSQSKVLPELLFRWIEEFEKDHSNKFMPVCFVWKPSKRLEELFNSKSRRFSELLDLLPQTVVIQSIKLTFDHTESHQDLGSYMIYLWIGHSQTNVQDKIEVDPDRNIPIVSAIIQAGLGREELLLDYLRAIHDKPELIRDDLAGWLSSRSDIFFYEKDRGKIASLIFKHGIPARIVLVKYPEELFRINYPLSIRDITSVKVVEAILPSMSKYGEEKFLHTDIWYNEVWCKALFSCSYGTKFIIQSVLATAQARRTTDDSIEWLQKVLVPVCKRQAKLRESLCLAAWKGLDDMYPSSIARLLLTRDSICQTWELSQQVAKAQELHISKNWKQLILDEREVADAIFTLDQMRDMFFKKYLGKKGRDNRLDDPEKWAFLFRNDPTQIRLKTWLLKNEHRIHKGHWLKWIEHWNFHTDPQIIKRLQTLLNDPDDDVRMVACRLMG